VQYVYKYACNLIKVHIIIILNVQMGGVKLVKVGSIPFRGGVWVLNTTFWQITVYMCMYHSKQLFALSSYNITHN
jgi:hypothetical protein